VFTLISYLRATLKLGFEMLKLSLHIREVWTVAWKQYSCTHKKYGIQVIDYLLGKTVIKVHKVDIMKSSE
jgi:hypothetical protein